MEGEDGNWSESVEDLVNGGEIDKAISLLESLVSNLETLENSSHQSDLQLSSALFDLSKLYSTKGFSLKADDTHSRALLLKQCSNKILSPQHGLEMVKDSEEDLISRNAASICNESSEDDWEAIADRPPDELLSPQCLRGVSKLTLEDTKVQTPKRRGRGTFSYRKHGLYSDQQSDGPVTDSSENEEVCHSSGDAETRDVKYGTRHVLVLADFPPSIRTTDLEKLLENYKNRGVVIRWVNDTVALAVFRTPSIALEAGNCIQCPFTVRVLEENDVLLSSIPPRDLEPPRQRPETSARTAERLIAQVVGLKLPLTSFGSKELRKQEEARKNRIVLRQSMRDDAWGDDVK